MKLCNRKIDIKTRAELEEMGKDFDTLLAEAEIRREEMRRERERREIERLEAEARAAEEKRLKAAEELIRKANENGPAAETEEEIIPEEMREAVKEKIRTDMAMLPEETPAEPAAVETPAEPETPAVEEPVTEEPEQPEETLAEPETPAVEETPAAEPKNKRIKADLEEIAAKNEYVSVFEKLADTSKPKTPEKPKRKKRKGDDDEFKTRNKILEQQLRKDISVDIKPVYTEEELEEIERQQLEEEESKYDIDYDEYEDYYDDEEMM